MNLAELPRGSIATVTRIGGSGSFRRRLMELGLLPGTQIEVLGRAPLGDPLELLVRGSSLSIRRSEALTIVVEPLAKAGSALSSAKAPLEPRSISSVGSVEGMP